MSVAKSCTLGGCAILSAARAAGWRSSRPPRPVAQPGTQTRTGSPGSLAREQSRDDLRSSAANASGSRKKSVTPISRSRNSSVTSSGSLPQPRDIGVDVGELHHLHPPLDPAQEGLLLVAAKSWPTARAGWCRSRARAARSLSGVPGQALTQLVRRHEAADIADQLVGHLLDRQHEVDQPGSDGTEGMPTYRGAL